MGKKQNDATSPNHYKLFANDLRYAKDIEAIDIIKASLSKKEFAGYCKGNMLKYLIRHHEKNGDEDVRKAGVYKEFLDNA